MNLHMAQNQIFRVLSLGAGVQSSTLALMANDLDLRIDAAIFADTQAEPETVYTWLDWLEQQVSFPIYRVTKGNLTADSMEIRYSSKSDRTYWKSLVPFFMKNMVGKKGMLMRQCTRDYKINVINKKIKELANVKRGEKDHKVTVYIGISTDEAMRMKPSVVPWIKNEWPLIDAGISRQGCLSWMEKNWLIEPPRSACVYCPYHSDHEWHRLKTEQPKEFARAVEYEKAAQIVADEAEAVEGIPYLHASLCPLNEVVFDTSKTNQLDLFGEECAGICGV